MSTNNKSAFDLEIQNIANKVKADVEKELQRVFQTFDVVEHHPIQNTTTTNNKTNDAYSMKVRTSDDDNSHLRLRTWRRDPFSAWESAVQEFFRPMSPFDSMLSPFDPFRTGFGTIQALADRIKTDVERDLNRTFNVFDVMEHHPILTDPEHTSYFMRVKTDDNGHVRVKTIKKTPDSDWQTHVEEYNRGQPAAVENNQSQGQLQNNQPQGQAMKTENDSRREKPAVEIEEEPYKPSGSQSTNA